MPKPIIIVDHLGDEGVKVEACHFTGGACTEATRFIENALGAVQQRELKPEFHRKARTGLATTRTQGLTGSDTPS